MLPALAECLRRGTASFPKGPEAAYAQRVYCYEQEGADLTRALTAWQARLRRAIPPDLEEFRGVVRPEPYRVEEKAAEVLSLLAEGPVPFEDLIRRSASRSEATAAFLALLELCRQGKVCLAGEMENPVIAKMPEV